jgi:hypothetical protein
MQDHIPASWSVMATIVYLDQCHWITMARARVARHKVQVPEELQAADALWARGRAGA